MLAVFRCLCCWVVGWVVVVVGGCCGCHCVYPGVHVLCCLLSWGVLGPVSCPPCSLILLSSSFFQQSLLGLNQCAFPSIISLLLSAKLCPPLLCTGLTPIFSANSFLLNVFTAAPKMSVLNLCEYPDFCNFLIYLLNILHFVPL